MSRSSYGTLLGIVRSTSRPLRSLASSCSRSICSSSFRPRLLPQLLTVHECRRAKPTQAGDEPREPGSYAGRSDGVAGSASHGSSRRGLSMMASATSTSVWPLCCEWSCSISNARSASIACRAIRIAGPPPVLAGFRLHDRGVSSRRVSVRLRAASRLVVGPLIVAVLAGVLLARFGVFRAAVAAYLVFIVAHVAVRQWTACICGSRVGGCAQSDTAGRS